MLESTGAQNQMARKFPILLSHRLSKEKYVISGQRQKSWVLITSYPMATLDSQYDSQFTSLAVQNKQTNQQTKNNTQPNQNVKCFLFPYLL